MNVRLNAILPLIITCTLNFSLTDKFTKKPRKSSQKPIKNFARSKTAHFRASKNVLVRSHAGNLVCCFYD